MTRARWPGTAEEFAKLLEPHATIASFLKYAEEAQVAKAPLLVHRFTQHKDILNTLYQAQNNFAFPRATVRQGLTVLANHKAEAWNLDKDAQKEYEEVMTNRIMNFTHCANQGMSKKAKWLQDLLEAKQAEK